MGDYAYVEQEAMSWKEFTLGLRPPSYAAKRVPKPKENVEEEKKTARWYLHEFPWAEDAFPWADDLDDDDIVPDGLRSSACNDACVEFVHF